MINKIIALVARLTVGKHLVSAIAWVHNKASGHRSEIILGIIAIVHTLKLTGLIPGDVADTIETSLAAILPITLAEKVAKVKASIDQIAPEPPKADDSVETKTS